MRLAVRFEVPQKPAYRVVFIALPFLPCSELTVIYVHHHRRSLTPTIVIYNMKMLNTECFISYSACMCTKPGDDPASLFGSARGAR